MGGNFWKNYRKMFQGRFLGKNMRNFFQRNVGAEK